MLFQKPSPFGEGPCSRRQVEARRLIMQPHRQGLRCHGIPSRSVWLPPPPEFTTVSSHSVQNTQVKYNQESPKQRASHSKIGGSKIILKYAGKDAT